MKINITNLYGFAHTSAAWLAQNTMAQLARTEGINELGIFNYPVDSDTPDQLRTRIDGIIAAIEPGDILIFQLPTWNYLTFERKLVHQAKIYGARIVMFIHDVPPLMFKVNYQDWIKPHVEFYNQADALILPSPQMEQYLRQEGLTVDKIVYQHLWDHPTTYQPQVAQFQRELTFLGNPQRFPFVNDWQYATPLRLYANLDNFEAPQNVFFQGYLPDELLLPQLNRGFGLCWSVDTPNQEERKYSRLNASYKLSTYLAAGMPVIANADISAANLIKDHQLGFLAESLDEVNDLVQNCTPADYQQMAQRVHDYGYLLRNGYVFKRILGEVVEKLLTV